MKNQKAKFIIFGQGRSGSNLLKTLLNSHPDLFCENEIFKRRRLRMKSPMLYHLAKLFPQLYIRFKAGRVKMDIYGFKLHWQQLYKPRENLLWLRKHGYKIIYLHRENIIKQSISFLIAKQTDQWIKKKNSSLSRETFTLDPNDLLRQVEIRQKRYMQIDHCLEDIEHLKVSYEYDLYDSKLWKATTTRIYHFLGTNPVEVNSRRQKTDHRPDSERIENFEALMNYLKENGQSELVAKYHKLAAYY